MSTQFTIGMLALVGLIALIGFIIYRTGKHRSANTQIYEEAVEAAFGINTTILQEYGFNIHDTKDKLYALHPNGVSMTWTEGHEWAVKIRDSGDVWHDKIETIQALLMFCDKHNHPIKKQEDGTDSDN